MSIIILAVIIAKHYVDIQLHQMFRSKADASLNKYGLQAA